MKKIVLLSSLIVFLSAAPAWSRPPGAVTLSYDLKKQSLHIEVEHTIDNRRKEYIYKVEIRVNNGAPIEQYERIQNDIHTYTADIAVKAKDGDRITVKAFAREGGSSSGELTVVDEEKEEPK